MNSIYLEAIEEYEHLTGTPYRDECYPTPAFVPSELLKIVSKVKVSQASKEQIDLIYQTQQYNQSGIVVLPDDKKYLVDDFNACKERMELWNTTL
ncbi:hypothetical protein [Pseudomonas sp. MYb193]|uniref:hypothetical protein n=1 Tax=Pseudomonas sp. MYb193 TaxID=1827300 RepID=UPI000D20CC50|nr:hypothetical protein [Pseudomonas sp. MYb193]AVJ25404.1 hypothetical protein CLM72_28270 [Pseudomonas sp. MYb193]